MIRNLSMVLFIGLGACVSHDAPGTRPADMSARAHVQECRNHEQTAQAQDKRAKELDGARGTYTAEYAGVHEREVAKRHGQAAKAVDPGAPDCP